MATDYTQLMAAAMTLGKLISPAWNPTYEPDIRHKLMNLARLGFPDMVQASELYPELIEMFFTNVVDQMMEMFKQECSEVMAVRSAENLAANLTLDEIHEIMVFFESPVAKKLKQVQPPTATEHELLNAVLEKVQAQYQNFNNPNIE